MEKIVNFNCERMCNEKYCNMPYTYFCDIEFLGMKIHLAFCERHANQFENLILKYLKEVKNES